jgi:CRP-like cAMP-binding protein
MAMTTQFLASTIGAWLATGVSSSSLTRLEWTAREYDAMEGIELLREGSETAELGLVTRGRVALTEHVPGRGPVTLMTVEPGDLFGWSSLVPPYRATSTVTTVEPVRVVAFDGPRLRQALRADPELAAAVYQRVLVAVARRLIATRHQLLDVYRAEGGVPW